MANRNRNSETVVGVFLDQQHANQAIQYLQQQGYNAQIADKSAIKAFRSTGLEDDVINLYENRLKEGNSIVTVTGDNGEEAMRQMLQMGAEYINISDKGGTPRYNWMQGQTQRADYYRNLDRTQRQYGWDEQQGRAWNEDELRVQLREETLQPIKQAVQAGEVQLNKTVHEREQDVPVNLRREEVYVNRQAVDRPAEPGEISDMQDEVVRVPVYEEQAELQKQARVREEVNIGKRAVEEQHNLKGTTRHEHLEVNETGNSRIEGDVQGEFSRDHDRTNQ
jgi:uncharacterized protein (TIGR02271 family)